MNEFKNSERPSFNEVIDNFQTIYSKALHSKMAKKYEDTHINLSAV